MKTQHKCFPTRSFVFLLSFSSASSKSRKIFAAKLFMLFRFYAEFHKKNEVYEDSGELSVLLLDYAKLWQNFDNSISQVSESSTNSPDNCIEDAARPHEKSHCSHSYSIYLKVFPHLEGAQRSSDHIKSLLTSMNSLCTKTRKLSQEINSIDFKIYRVGDKNK